MNNRYLFINSRKILKKLDEKVQKKIPEEIITEIFKNEDNTQALSSAFTSPMLEMLNRESFARRVFQVQPLPDGALPVYHATAE